MIALISKYSIGIIFLLAILWDVIAVIIDKHGTLSNVIITETTNYLCIAVILGFMIGHLLWPMDIVSELNYWKASLPFATFVLMVVVAIDFTIGLPISFPVVYLLAGIILGHFLWPQKLI